MGERKISYIGEPEEVRNARNFQFARGFWIVCAVASILLIDEYMGIVFVCTFMYISVIWTETNYLLAKFIQNQSNK